MNVIVRVGLLRTLMCEVLRRARSVYKATQGNAPPQLTISTSDILPQICCNIAYHASSLVATRIRSAKLNIEAPMPSPHGNNQTTLFEVRFAGRD